MSIHGAFLIYLSSATDMKKKIFFFLLLCNACLNAQTLQEYFFNNNFNGTAGGGPLTEVLSCGAGLGSFGTQSITTTSGFCSNSTAFCFNDGGGLSYPNTSITSQYSINLFCKFNALSGYTRVIDFSNGASDNGIYLLNNCLVLYPVGTIGPCPYFNPNLYYLFTFVRDGATNTISVYVNGVFFSSYVDTGNLYRPATATTPIIFFKDDNAVPCESAPGCIGYASISSSTLSPTQVNTVWINICNTVSSCTATAGSSSSVCPGQSANLGGSPTAVGGSGTFTYSWTPSAGLNNASVANPVATPTVQTTYTVTINDGAGCIRSDSVKIFMNPLPTVTVSPGTTICTGGNTTLTAGGAVSYTWAPATGLSSVNGASVVATASTTTIYTVTGTNASGCVNSATVQIAIGSNPVITISPNTTVCPAGSTSLTASGATSYTWSPATSLSSANGASVTSTPVATTIYTITGTNASGCTGTNTVQVSLNTIPSVTGSPNATICVSTNTVLTAAGAVSYTWSPSGSLSSATGASVTATPTALTIYTITGANASGCTATYTLSVSVDNIPIISVAGASLCASSSATLTASGATSYTWSPSTSLSSANGASVIATPSVTTTYTVAGLTGACTGSAIATASVIVVSPTITASSYTYCIGGTGVTLTGSGASSYSWSPAFGLSATSGAAVSVSPTVTTTYTLIASIGACSTNQTVSINVAAVSSLSIVAGSTLICPNGLGTTLTASGGSTYTWSPGSQTTSTLQANPLNSTTYTVVGQSAAGCATLPAVITVSVNPAINATLTASSPSVCLTKTVAISAIPVGSTYTYTWLPVSSIQGSNAGSSIIARPGSTATVIYSLSISNGLCKETNTISLQVFNCVPPISQFSTLTNDSICTHGCISFTATSTGIQPFSYQWLFPGGTPPTSTISNPVICYASSGSYPVSLITGNVFGNDTLFMPNYISVTDTPSVRAFGDTLISVGQTAPINVTSNGTSYYWSPDNGTIACATCSNTVVQPTVTTQYMVTAYNSPYCKRRDSVLVKVDFTCGDFFIPNVFSPNGDGLNESINIHGFCIATYNLKIFNRWGEVIFETSDKTNGWDGTFHGKPLDTGVFVYSVDGITIERKPFSKKGNITLLR